MSQLFASGGLSIGASASASVLPVNIQGLVGRQVTRCADTETPGGRGACWASVATSDDLLSLVSCLEAQEITDQVRNKEPQLPRGELHGQAVRMCAPVVPEDDFKSLQRPSSTQH